MVDGVDGVVLSTRRGHETHGDFWDAALRCVKGDLDG